MKRKERNRKGTYIYIYSLLERKKERMFSQTLKSQLTKQAIRRYTVSAIDGPGKVSTLTVRVHAGARHAPKDGMSHLLSRFNFMDTGDKSALRLVRESELLGGRVESSVCRQYITLRATFLKEDLPYYVNAIGNVLYKSSFKPHEFTEQVLPAAEHDLHLFRSDNVAIAKDALFNVTYRNGLGNPVYYDGVEPITLDEVKQFADKVYTRDNIEITGTNVNEADLKKFVDQSLINSLPVGKSLKPTTAPRVYYGESRIRRRHGQSVAGIAVPVTKEQFAQFEVLSTYLTSPLFEQTGAVNSAALYKFPGEHGLFTMFVKDADAKVVSENIKSIVQKLKRGVDISGAKELARTRLVNNGELSSCEVCGEELNVDTVKDFRLGSKFNYVALGDISRLPHADEL